MNKEEKNQTAHERWLERHPELDKTHLYKTAARFLADGHLTSFNGITLEKCKEYFLENGIPYDTEMLEEYAKLGLPAFVYN